LTEALGGRFITVVSGCEFVTDIVGDWVVRVVGVVGLGASSTVGEVIDVVGLNGVDAFDAVGLNGLENANAE